MVRPTSATRVSIVGYRGDRRARSRRCGHPVPPDDDRPATASSYSSTDPTGGAGTVVGQREAKTSRWLAHPPSRPSQIGELAVSAMSTGNHGRRRSSASTPSCLVGTATWTWHAQVPLVLIAKENAGRARRSGGPPYRGQRGRP